MTTRIFGARETERIVRRRDRRADLSHGRLFRRVSLETFNGKPPGPFVRKYFSNNIISLVVSFRAEFPSGFRARVTHPMDTVGRRRVPPRS